MFYKRISDLHPLGITRDNWNTVEPIPIPDPGKCYKTNKHNESKTLKNLGNPGSKPCDYYTEINAAFNTNTWYGTPTQGPQISYEVATLSQQEDSDPTQISSEYYAKSLWFEVGVTKGDKEQPTSQSIQKYQSKRVNAYLLFTNIDEISASEISASVIYSASLYCNDLHTSALTANIINTTIIDADYGDFNSLKVSSISAGGISSTLGIINNIHGDNLYYNRAKFTDISVTGKAELTAEAAYWADVAEIYTADKGYLYGTLVKFGGEKEITLANDKANAVISENPAITLNSGNRNENATPIVLTGRSKVRTIHPVKKFDKIYLSETPGVGSISSYKISSATMPIGIALEDKPYDEEGLIECILQLNFE